MISDKFRCIFIHIPKTAGTSIEYKLQSFDSLHQGVQDHRSIREIEPNGIASISRDIITGNAEMLVEHLKNLVRRKQRATPQQYQEYFKFAFVRNPWSRAFSWYQNVMRDENHQKRHKVPADCTYEKFLVSHSNQWALRPQLYWLVDRKGDVPLDFIGRFENLAEGFERVSEALKLDEGELPQMIASKSKRHYSDFYNDKTRKLIADRYAEEIEYFGYSFDE